MILHDWFGRHLPNVKISHWDKGHFVTRCTICEREMIKLPGLPWRLLRRETPTSDATDGRGTRNP